MGEIVSPVITPALPLASGFPPGSEAPKIMALWSDVLGLIARLHDREVDTDLLIGLRGAGIGELFANLLQDEEGREVAKALSEVLRDAPDQPGSAYLDELAVDFADIYLNHGFRVAPTGSVWLTDDHLERQQPMFDVRDWYQHYGIRVPNWRIRSDDHIVHELQFVQHLLGLASPASAYDAAVFLDRHVLPWVPEFCTRVAQRARQPFHALAALLTRAALEALRETLTTLTDAPREVITHAWAREADRARRAAETPDVERPFVPGLAESW